MTHPGIHAIKGLLLRPLAQGVCSLAEAAPMASWAVTWRQVAPPTSVKLGTPVRPLQIWS